MFNKNSKKIHSSRGFTLVEIIVASGLFIVVMLVMSGAVLSIFDANQKSKNLRAVMDNLNLSLESMTRTVRFGTEYSCGGGTTPLSCPEGTYTSSLGVTSMDGVRTVYALSNGRISRTTALGTFDLTSPDVTITRLAFRVSGAEPYTGGAPGNLLQPKVIITISGYVGTKVTTQSSFSLQTSVSQRVFDFDI